MTKTFLGALVVAVVLSPGVALTQSGKPKPTTATYITKEEVDTVNAKGQGVDRAIKVVDIGHENFAATSSSFPQAWCMDGSTSRITWTI